MRVRARLLVVGIVSWLPMQQQPKRTNATTALQQQQRRFCRRLIHRKVLDACTKHGRLVISVRDWSFASSLVIDNQDWPCGKSCWSFLHRTFRPFDIRAKNIGLVLLILDNALQFVVDSCDVVEYSAKRIRVPWPSLESSQRNNDRPIQSKTGIVTPLSRNDSGDLGALSFL